MSQPHFFKTGCSFLKSAPWRLQCANHLLTFVLFRPSPKHPIYLSPHDHIPYIIIPSRNNIFFNFFFLAIFFFLFLNIFHSDFFFFLFLVTCSIVLSLQNICVSQMKSLSTSPFIYRPLPSLSHLPLHLIKRKIKKRM